MDLRGVGNWEGGLLQCPIAADFCRFSGCPDDCSALGDCYEGTCFCFPGFSGPSCNQVSCSTDSDCPVGLCNTTTNYCLIFPGTLPIPLDSESLSSRETSALRFLTANQNVGAISAPMWAVLVVSLGIMFFLLASIWFGYKLLSATWRKKQLSRGFLVGTGRVSADPITTYTRGGNMA